MGKIGMQGAKFANGYSMNVKKLSLVLYKYKQNCW